MPKKFFIFLALLLLCGSCFAISAQDAVNFATKQNNFLYSGETVEIYPNSRISSQGSYYWVIAALSGGSLSGFVPVLNKEKPELPGSTITRRELIKTAYVLRYQRKLNETSSQQGMWLFDAKNVKFFSDLSQDLKNEKVDLTTVKTSLQDFPKLQGDVDQLQAMLDEMFPLAADISDKLLAATSFESSFVAEPDTNHLNEFKGNFLDCFGLIQNLEQKRSAYLALLDSLRQSIALTDLPLDTKQGLNSLANLPNSAQQFSSKASIAVDLHEKIAGIFDNAAANVDNLALDLSTREKRNSAFQALYGSDEEILEKTGQGSLSQLFDVLLSDQYFFLWEDQDNLAYAMENWEKAKVFYGAGSFPQAEQYAAKAKKDAIPVYEAGLKEEPPIFDTDLLFNGIVLLIVAVIIVYVLRNRDKLSGFVSGKSEEEVQLHGWEK